MLSDNSLTFTKENLNMYLNETAKRYKKVSGRRIPAEIILVGGASILANYGFRDSTTDIDAVILPSSAMKEAVDYVTDKFSLPEGWLNADFQRTTSYSEKLIQYSNYYKTFANIVDVRTVAGEYLLAMKLVSGRKYKHDLSDVIGILKDERDAGNEIDLERIKKATEALYGSWDEVSEESKVFIEEVLEKGDYEMMLKTIAENETKTKDAILEFRKNNPDGSNLKTANEILEMIKKQTKE